MLSSECDRMPKVLILLAVITSTATLILDSATLERTRMSHPVADTVTHVPAIVGSDADLPCGTDSSESNDKLVLVVWYRDAEPIYSYDNRVQGPKAHWIDKPYLGRTHWYNHTASLQFQDVQARDRATYRCRVDFILSATKNYLIALDVIELPGKPVIFDQDGKDTLGFAGPYREGSAFYLICKVTGGYPIPKIQWYRGDVVLNSLNGGEAKPTRSLVLEIRNATRLHLFAEYTCVADNTVLAPPQKTSVKVDLYLKPLAVEILVQEQPLSVGRQANLHCKTTGARPPATVSWWLGGKKMNATTKESGLDANETLSLLQWIPIKEQNGQVLTCMVEHPQFNGLNWERKLPLNVYYMPTATIHLGAKINPNDIEEGDDVYFGCEVDANPSAYKVVWEHNGVQLQNNPSQGVIVTGYTHLALRNVSRHQAGNYTCTASNVEGDDESTPLNMRVVYKPLCLKPGMKIIGAALQESTSVVCEVDAFPPPDTFDWTLNSSVGSVKVNHDRYTVETKEGRSVLTFTPVSDVDYGALSCKATNLAGQQVTPCVYTVLPATSPDPPTNCTVYNLTDDSLDLLCTPGYDGGLQCVFVVEVWSGRALVVNASNGIALWNLRRLGANRKLTMLIYAANARGRSNHISLPVTTFMKPSSRTEPQETWDTNWAVGICLGTLLAVGLILCLAFIAMKIRRRTRDYEVALPPTKNQKVVQKRNSPQSFDDKNPDLIPLSKEATEAPLNPPVYSAIVAPNNSSSAHSLQRPHAPMMPISSYSFYTEMQNDARNVMYGTTRPHREIVTTRTPLLAAQQESRV